MDDVNKLFDAQQCFAFTPQLNFPAHNLNFHKWRSWLDQIQATFQNLFYFNHFDTRYLVFCMHNFLCLWVAFIQRVFFFVVYFNLRPTKKNYFKIKISVKKLTMKHKSFIVTQQLLIGIKTDQFELDGEVINT